MYIIESQKGIITIQQCSIENLEGQLSLYKVYGDSALLVLIGISLYSINALLVLSWWFMKYISSIESQKGIIAHQRCSVENQKGAIPIHVVQQ